MGCVPTPEYLNICAMFFWDRLGRGNLPGEEGMPFVEMWYSHQGVVPCSHDFAGSSMAPCTARVLLFLSMDM